ncbi:MAG: TolC family protein [Burkholderiaceae bacterium]
MLTAIGLAAATALAPPAADAQSLSADGNPARPPAYPIDARSTEAQVPADVPIDPANLSLATAELRARAANRDLWSARRRIQAAEADRLGAQALPNPNLSISIDDYRPRTGLGSGSLRDKLMTTQIGIDQLIERGGKRTLRMRVADELLKASRYDYDDTLRAQTLLVRAAYYDLVLAQDTVEIVSQQARLYDETRDAAQRRLKAGDIAATDASRIDVDRLRAQSDLQNAIQERTDAQVALAALLAVEPDASLLRATDGWPGSDQPPATAVLTGDPSALDALLVQRPDVLAARTRIDAASANRELARSLRTRDIGVAGWFKRDSTAGDATPPYYSNAIGLSVSIPLLINNRYDGEIARAESDYGDAQDQLARTLGAARNEIAQSASSLQTARRRDERYRNEILPTATRNAEAYEFAFRRGALEVTDLLDARRTLRATQLEALDARSDYAKALMAWMAAVQVQTTP